MNTSNFMQSILEIQHEINRLNAEIRVLKDKQESIIDNKVREVIK